MCIRDRSRTGSDPAALLGVILGFFGGELLLLSLKTILTNRKEMCIRDSPWLWMGWTAVAISLLVFNPHTSVSPWGLFGGMRYLYWIQMCIRDREITVTWSATMKAE